MTNTTAQTMTTEYREQRSILSAQRRYDPAKSNNKPNFAAQQGKPQAKRPPQRNLEPHERILANAKREALSIDVSLLNEESVITGRVMDFGKYEVIVETKDGTRLCLFKSAIRSFHVIRSN